MCKSCISYRRKCTAKRLFIASLEFLFTSRKLRKKNIQNILLIVCSTQEDTLGYSPRFFGKSVQNEDIGFLLYSLLFLVSIFFSFNLRQEKAAC